MPKSANNSRSGGLEQDVVGVLADGSPVQTFLQSGCQGRLRLQQSVLRLGSFEKSLPAGAHVLGASVVADVIHRVNLGAQVDDRRQLRLCPQEPPPSSEVVQDNSLG